MFRFACSFALLLLTLPAVAWAQQDDDLNLVKAELVADAAAVEPGGTFTLGVLFTVRPEWHIYWLNPGESGIATGVKFNLPDGYKVGELQWPVPIRFDGGGAACYGYQNQVLLFAEVSVPKEAKPGETLAVTADVNWLCCKEECIPGDAKLSLKLPVKAKAAPANKELFTKYRSLLPDDGSQIRGDVVVENEKIGQLRIYWKKAVKDVEFFPATTTALELKDVKVDHANRQTTIRYTPDIFAKSEVKGGTTRGLLIYRDETGARRGVYVAVKAF